VSFDADLVIVGAGPTGLALGCALADAGVSVAVVEKQDEVALENAADDGREIALTHRSRTLLERLGIWQRLPAAVVSPLREVRVVDGSSPLVLHLPPPPAGGQPLGWLVPNHEIRRAALAALRERPAATLHAGCTVRGLHRDGTGVTLHCADGHDHRTALVVAADSRFSALRRIAGIGCAIHDYGRSVVVGRVAHERSHDDVAWECFRYGNTLALLPLAGQQCSAVVTMSGDRAGEWRALSDDAFAERIETQSEGRLGAMRAVGARHHHPLVGVYARRFVGERFALAGDAAVGMHPVTAHGYNFGLYGVEVLAREIGRALAAGEGVASPRALQAYEHTHRRATLPMWLATNAIVSLFTDERTGAKIARRAVIAAAERLPAVSGLLKAAVARQLMARPAPKP